jgi:hypothetical protein
MTKRDDQDDILACTDRVFARWVVGNGSASGLRLG